jgi:hypothetical protein
MSMANFDSGKVVQAASAAAAAGTVPGIRPKSRELSPLAQLAAAQHLRPAFSPIVVAGIVRLIEFALIATVGVLTYFAYVYQTYGQVLEWHYIATAFGVAMLVGVFDDRGDDRAPTACAGSRSSARSTISSNSRAAPASTS